MNGACLLDAWRSSMFIRKSHVLYLACRKRIKQTYQVNCFLLASKGSFFFGWQQNSLSGMGQILLIALWTLDSWELVHAIFCGKKSSYDRSPACFYVSKQSVCCLPAHLLNAWGNCFFRSCFSFIFSFWGCWKRFGYGSVQVPSYQVFGWNQWSFLLYRIRHTDLLETTLASWICWDSLLTQFCYKLSGAWPNDSVRSNLFQKFTCRWNWSFTCSHMINKVSYAT